jgi:hypothetical protein
LVYDQDTQSYAIILHVAKSRPWIWVEIG